MKKKLDDDTSVADLNAQIETLRNDLVGLTQTVTDIGKPKGEEAVSAAKTKVVEERDKVSEQADATRRQAIELHGQADELVRKQPAAVLGIAAGLDFLVGFLSARK